MLARSTFDLHDARVLKAEPPVYRIAVGYTIRGEHNGPLQVRDDVFEVRWEDDDVEVLVWAGPYEGGTETVDDAWPPPPSDPALLELEERLRQSIGTLEQRLALYLRWILKVRIIDLRAMNRAGSKSTVLIKYDCTMHRYQLPPRTLVFDISTDSEPFEVLGHRDYIATEWQSADADG